MDARARLILSQLVEHLRATADRLEVLMGESMPIRPNDITLKKPEGERKRMICSKCHFVGGNARGCGRSHPTQDQPPTS